jgi:hypothetical protein
MGLADFDDAGEFSGTLVITGNGAVCVPFLTFDAVNPPDA